MENNKNDTWLDDIGPDTFSNLEMCDKKDIDPDKNEDKHTGSDQKTIKKDLHTYTDPVKKYHKFNLDDEHEFILEPAGTNEQAIELSNKLDALPQEEFEKKFNDGDNYIAINAALNGEAKANRHNIYGGKTTEDMVNEVLHGDKTYGIKPVTVNSKKNIVSGDTAVAMFTSSLGIGNIMHIPLWNSGLWISIRPPEDSDIVNLEIALNNYQLDLGRTTNTLVYSNYSVIFIKLVTDFIEAHIMNSSLKVPSDESIMDYILISDLYPMVLGIVCAMYPKGYEISKGCKNTLIMDNNNNLKCNFVGTGKVNPRKMLFVNRTRINNVALTHMAKRQPNATTVDMIRNYQKLIGSGSEVTKSLVSNGISVKVTFKSPSISNMIESGELWVNTIISKAEEAFTKADTDVIKNKRIKDIVKASVLGVYSIYAVKLVFEQNGEVKTVVDRNTINTMLGVMSSEEKLTAMYGECIKNYINNDMVSMVGIPDFICPTCGEPQLDKDVNKSFKEIIPLNMLEDFFDLSTFRTKEIMGRKEY